MKKLSHFIVSKRYWILGAMLCLTALCAFLSLQVSVNTDMTKYLPDDSAMRTGMRIMEEEFPETETGSTIRIMADGLSAAQKDELQKKLEALPFVDSVSHDDSADYNRETYSLFEISTPYEYGSDEELSIEAALDRKFSEYHILWQNGDDTFEGISSILLVTALSILMIILFVMSESWFEPLLFLLTIGFAVVINAGTNIFLGEISNITSSITAILQLVLSMDYSIILINRYRQEKETGLTNQEAMTAAVRHSFGSVASSSMTTVVGLLALVFMKFKIGMDLGIVLAKGVFISMVCVITVLPCLILLCDKLIAKTAKKALHIPMGRVAKFSYRFRYPLLLLFVLAFFGFNRLQGNTLIAYTLETPDPISEIFPANNMLVMVYDNTEEEKAARLADSLENHDNVKQVLGYPNLLGKPYTAQELKASIDELGDSLGVKIEAAADLDPALLNLIYYHYYDGQTHPLTMAQFLQFLSEDVLHEDPFANAIDEDLQEQAELLMQFSDPEELTAPKTYTELAALFGIDASAMKTIFILYNAGDVSKKTMTLPQFTGFLSSGLLDNSMFAGSFDQTAKSKLQYMNRLIQCAVSGKALTSSEMAEILEMDEAVTAQLYFLYLAANDAAFQQGTASAAVPPADMPPAISLPAFTDFLVNRVLSDETYSGAFDEAAKAQLIPLNQMVQTAVSGIGLDSTALAKAFGMDESTITLIFRLYYGGDGTGKKMSVQQAADVILSDFTDLLDEETKTQLTGVKSLIDAVVSGEEYSPEKAAQILRALTDKLDEATVDLLYFYYASQNDADPSWTLSIDQLFTHLCGSFMEDPRFEALIDTDARSRLKDAQKTLEEGIAMLKSDKYSRLILNTTFPVESDETDAFLLELHEACADFAGGCYFIGNSAMTYEMQQTFDSELRLITMLTSIAIFLIVMISFRSWIIPLLLVLLVQCSVYLTVTVVGIQGYSIYFLALLIVECILMGATIDYGILFTNYYREKRKEFNIKEALGAAYQGSIHTIMTSGLIIVLVTGILGYTTADPTVGQIARTISTGALCAILMILFVLPGMLAAFDKFIIHPDREKQHE